MQKDISIKEFRGNLAEVANRVEAGEMRIQDEAHRLRRIAARAART